MKTLTIFLFALCLQPGARGLRAQALSLDSVSGLTINVYHSAGQRERAKEIGTRAQKAIAYTAGLLGFSPEVRLLVLSPADWPKHTKMPVYGMPHYADSRTLIVAAEDNAFWKSFIPPLEQLPAELAARIRATYTHQGQLSMQPFFDLLALHELGHAFHQQGGLTMQRKWMGELFCNLLLHTYIAANEPAQLPALTVFPNMVVAGGTEGFSFTTLAQFETNYNELGTKHPRNYGWYQCRLHAAAREIYDVGGKEVLQKLWTALKGKGAETDAQLSEQMSREVHPAVSRVLEQW